MNIGEWIHQLSDQFNSVNLPMLLLIGSGILAVSLLVLALTRWGHSRPVWKCVILSIVAHILLIGYAYGTRLIFDTPNVVQADTPMRVNLIENTGESTEGNDGVDSSEKRWDQFVNEQALPMLDALDRPAIDSEVVIDKTLNRTIETPGFPETDRAEELDQLSQIPQSFAQPDFVEKQVPISKEPVELPPAADPQPIDVARRGEQNATPDPQPMPFDMPQEMARQEVTNQMTPADADSGPVRPTESADDRAFISDLRDAQSKMAFTPESLPRPAVAPQFKSIKPLRAIPVASRKRATVEPRRIGDGQPLPRIYSLRNAENRLAIARQRGGSLATEQAVERGLRWLAENQEDNGSWDSQKSGGGQEHKIFGHDRNGAGAQAESGITALATLAFLAAGHSHLEGQYQVEVQKGLEYLVRQQKADGDLSGGARLFARMYCHSMALLAVSEALAMTGDQRLTNVVQNGVDYSVSAQNREDGGWRYQPGDGGDMSQFGWQVLALHSAKLGGIRVPEATFSRMRKFLESCSSGVGKGLASYRPNQGPSTTMTAEALLCRYFLSEGSVSEVTRTAATRQVATELPTPQHVNLYYWYYGTLAMYHSGGTDWDQWNTELKQTLLSLQNQHGPDAGSWPANGMWAGYGGTVYSTAIATLNLEVYYRYLPIYQEFN